MLAVAAARERVILHLMDKYPWDLFALNFGRRTRCNITSGATSRAEVNSRTRSARSTRGSTRPSVGSRQSSATTWRKGPSSRTTARARPRTSSFFIDEWLRSEGLLQFRNVAVASASRGFFGSPWTRCRERCRRLRKTLSCAGFLSCARTYPRVRASLTVFYLEDQRLLRRAPGNASREPRRPRSERHRANCGPQRYEELRTALIDKLRGLVDPVSGKALIEEVYRREEVYHGPFLESAPRPDPGSEGLRPGSRSSAGPIPATATTDR